MTFSKLFNEVHFYKSNFRFIVKTKVSNLQIQTVHCSSWRRNLKKEIQEKIKKICRDNLLKMPLVLASYFRTINWSLKIAKDDTLIRSLRFSWSWRVARFGTICTILKTWKHHGGVLLLVKVWVFLPFFKLYNCFQIAQRITNVKKPTKHFSSKKLALKMGRSMLNSHKVSMNLSLSAILIIMGRFWISKFIKFTSVTL